MDRKRELKIQGKIFCTDYKDIYWSQILKILEEVELANHAHAVVSSGRSEGGFFSSEVKAKHRSRYRKEFKLTGEKGASGWYSSLISLNFYYHGSIPPKSVTRTPSSGRMEYLLSSACLTRPTLLMLSVATPHCLSVTSSSLQLFLAVLTLLLFFFSPFPTPTWLYFYPFSQHKPLILTYYLLNL